MNSPGNNRKKRGLPLICLAITIVILIAGLWPFNFLPKNEVTWLDGQNGIHFGRRGIAFSKESIYGPQGAIRPDRPVSIELVVRPARIMSAPFSRILTLYGGGNHQFFTLAQRRSHLILRAAQQGKDLHHDFQEISVGDIFIKTAPRIITVTSNDGNTLIYADGEMINKTRNFPILPADSSVSGKLVLGNSPTGKAPWTGDLLFLAVYDRELAEEEVVQHCRDWTEDGTLTWSSGKTPTLLYRFDERMGSTSRNGMGDHYDISVPATFYVLQKTVLRPPWQEEYFHRYFIRDVVINILGFLPFGFFFTACLRKGDGLPSRSDIFLVAILGGGISLTIELFQIYIPTRTSSLADLLCNLLGTILGIYLFRWILLFLELEKRTNRYS
jgi:VanZ family protein